MKRVTRIHLAVARENRVTLLTQLDRRCEAQTLRGIRYYHGNAEARRQHRNSYGPLLD